MKMGPSTELFDIPREYRPIFDGIHRFNRIQSIVFDDVFKTRRHIVMSAPTGSGKTIIFELAIVEQLIRFRNADKAFKWLKIVYVAPTKALCNEVYMSWRKKFDEHNLAVGLVTGDADQEEIAELDDLESFQIIVTTPEKWDAMTRKWKDHREIAKMIKLVLIDEIHLVGDEYRGPTLEAIVSRIKTFQRNDEKDEIRFIAVSASLLNIEDISNWLNFGESAHSIKTYRFNEADRPVQLRRQVFGYFCSGNAFQFGIQLTYELIKIVKQLLIELSAEKQILIFCHTRNEIEFTLKQLQKDVKLQITDDRRIALQQLIEKIKDEKLKLALSHGFGFHHAGLLHEDREQIEEAYRNGSIWILLSTSTLAMGVNLPAHTVIIKSTESYINGATREIPETMILQMMGRAGRQKYNSTGRVCIMTRKERVRQYENLGSGSIPIESHLGKKLAEFLNAEIVLNTIHDMEFSLLQWIRTTFFYTCSIKRENGNRCIDEIDTKLKALCQREIQLLRDSQLVGWTQADGNISRIFSRPFGHVMAKFFLSISTMNRFHGFNGNESIDDILNKTVHCLEFSEFYLRNTDKKFLNDINSGANGKTLRFPIIGRITTATQKISCLIQAILIGIPIGDSSLQMDAMKMMRVADRILKGMMEYFRCEQFTKKCFTANRSAVVLSKSIGVRVWCDSANFYKCLGVSEEISNHFMRFGIRTVSTLLQTEPHVMENMVKKSPPFGKNFLETAARKLPLYEIQTEILPNHVFLLRVRQANGRFDVNMGGTVTLLVGDATNQLIVCEEIQTALNENGIFEKFINYSPKAEYGHIYVIHSHIVGVDVKLQFKLECRPDKNAEITNQVNKQSNQTMFRNPSNNRTVEEYFKVQKKPTEEEHTIFSSNYHDSTTQGSTSSSIPLYNFDYRTTPRESPDFFNRAPFEPILHPMKSPEVIETPIRKKIDVQKGISRPIGGFVTAKSIFNRGHNIEAKKLVVKPSGDNRSKKIDTCNGKTIPVANTDYSSEFDDDFMDLIFDEIDELEKSRNNQCGTKNNIAVAKGSNGAKKIENSIDKILGRPCKVTLTSPTTMSSDEDEDSLNNFEVTVRDDQMQCNINSFLNESEFTPTPREHSCTKSLTESAKTSSRVETFDSQPQMIFSKERPYSNNQRNTCFRKVDEYLKPGFSKTPTTSDGTERSDHSSTGSFMLTPRMDITKSQQKNLGKMSLSSFQYVPPTQMLFVSQSGQNGATRSSRSAMLDSPVFERKKLRPSITDLMQNAEKKREKENETRRHRLVLKPKSSLAQLETKPLWNPLGMPSRRTLLAHVKKTKTKDTSEADAMLEQCKQRLKSDKDYKSTDYEMDYVRYGVLKLTPKKKIEKSASPFELHGTSYSDAAQYSKQFNPQMF